MTETPNLERLSLVKDRLKTVNDFIAWMYGNHYAICEYDYISKTMQPIAMSIEQLVAAYFKLDLEDVQ